MSGTRTDSVDDLEACASSGKWDDIPWGWLL